MLCWLRKDLHDFSRCKTVLIAHPVSLQTQNDKLKDCLCGTISYTEDFIFITAKYLGMATRVCIKLQPNGSSVSVGIISHSPTQQVLFTKKIFPVNKNTHTQITCSSVSLQYIHIPVSKQTEKRYQIMQI